jgi:hypothetical protein
VSGFALFPFAVLLAWTLLGGSTFFLHLLAGLVTIEGDASVFFRRLSPAADDGSSVSKRARRRLKQSCAKWWARYEPQTTFFRIMYMHKVRML